jgi:hypothetical protein
MKIKLTIILLIQAFISYSQLYVDAGNDTTYCVQMYPVLDMYIGENVVIENAVEPIEIAWECQLDIGISQIFTASDLLSDTTAIISKYIDYPSDNKFLKFIINVKDASGSQAKDSLWVRFSIFAFSLIEWHATINQGDSIRLDGGAYIGGGIPPLQLWYTPSIGLSDSNDLAAWAKPDTSTLYYQMARDSMGCISTPLLVYFISVIPTDINSSTTTDAFVKQIGSQLIINPLFVGVKTVEVYTLSGKLLFIDETLNNSFELSSKLNTNGVYLCIITIDNKQYSIKFIKN